MYKETVVFMVIVISLIPVYRKHREQSNKLQTLTKYVWNITCVCIVVIGIKRKHTSGKGVHHIRAGCFHNNIPYKRGGKSASVMGKQGFETGKIIFGW